LPNVAKLSTASGYSFNEGLIPLGTQSIDNQGVQTTPIKIDENNVDYDHYQKSPESQRIQEMDSPSKYDRFGHSPFKSDLEMPDENDAPECENTIIEESILDIGHKFDNMGSLRDDDTENDINLKDTTVKSLEKIPSLVSDQLDAQKNQNKSPKGATNEPSMKESPPQPILKEATEETTLNTSLNIMSHPSKLLPNDYKNN